MKSFLGNQLPTHCGERTFLANEFLKDDNLYHVPKVALVGIFLVVLSRAYNN